MRPKSEPKQVQREFFQVELEQIIDMNHALVRLGSASNGQSLRRCWEQPVTRAMEPPAFPRA